MVSLDLTKREAAPATLRRIALATLPMTAGVRAVALLEVCEVRGIQWTILLSNLRDVGSGIVDPGAVSRSAFGEDNDVSLGALGVWTERAPRTAKYRMDVAVLHEDLKHLTGLVGEQHVVRDDNRSSTSRPKDGENVLNEVQLLVARLNDEVLALGRLVGTPRSEGRIRKHDIESLRTRRLINRIPEPDMGLDLMKVEIHERQPTWPRDEFLAEEGVRSDASRGISVERAASLLHEPVVGGDQKAASSARRVTNLEVRPRPWVGLDASDDRLDQYAGREVLPSTLLPFARCLLEQSLEGRRLHIDVERPTRSRR